MSSKKYNRTYHVPWSEGATNDDKIAKDISHLISERIIITEKIDGSNVCLEKEGCFARTHSGPPTHPSFDGFKALHAQIKHLIPDYIQVFGEWCYALHSISYDKLPHYFLMFGARVTDSKASAWYSWPDVKDVATKLNVPTVPVLWSGTVSSEKELKEIVNDLVTKPSCFGPVREGVVIRKESPFLDEEFSNCQMKWVRKNHVQTSEHWRNQQIVKNKLCQHNFHDKHDGGFTCTYCGFPGF